MKLKIMSDLHLEFSEYKFDLKETPEDSETTLILAGDIGVGKGACFLIKHWAKRFKYVIYIAGNHEFYGHVWEGVINDIKKELDPVDNIFFLEKESIELDGVSFFGATFWTPGGTEYQNSIAASHGFNDFRQIKRLNKRTQKPTRMNAATYLYYFRETIAKYEEWVDNGFTGKRVVIMHHAPSERSSLECYKGNDLNPFFFFDAEKYCKKLDKVDIIFHGHLHNMSYYKLDNGTQVICNPYGYQRYEVNRSFQDNLIIEI